MTGLSAQGTVRHALANYAATRAALQYVARSEASRDTYQRLGFKCGLEIHQQLLTEKKLFCHCPAGIYQVPGEFDAELVRHMRPTLSELGEYDGTALMEFRTRKNIIYRIASETACTYDIDDTPPFTINQEALDISILIALMLKCSIVGELHITRKQYLDGSIPTGFQRTAIVGIEGEIPITGKTVRIIQISIEEDSCREVSDIGHYRTYTTDRLGMPLIETVTYPDMLTPDEAAEAGQYLRFLARASEMVRTGMGAGRQDVNVSVTSGTRVEIKGVAHIKWIPELTHNEAFRQAALLRIKDQLHSRVSSPDDWRISHATIDNPEIMAILPEPTTESEQPRRLLAVNLTGFADLLSHFTQPGRTFAHELSERLKVVACLDLPNMVSSEDIDPCLDIPEWESIRAALNAKEGDAQLLFWATDYDIPTALQTIEERCQLAFQGVPNETRKSRPDGTTVFERVLPGPDRMYPDTDSAPIPVKERDIQRIGAEVPEDVAARMKQLQSWQVPESMHRYLLAQNLVPLIAQASNQFDYKPRFLARLFGQRLKDLEDKFPGWPLLPRAELADLLANVHKRKLHPDILFDLLAAWYREPQRSLDELLETIGYAPRSERDIRALIPGVRDRFARHSGATAADAEVHWVTGQMRSAAIGNIPLTRLRALVEKEVGRG